jgi:hypothetical protein
MEIAMRENIVKNILLIVLLVLFYNPVRTYLVASPVLTNPVLAGNLLIAVSIFAVTACFGCFAFTYEKSNIKRVIERYLAHLTSSLFMLILGLSLIFTSVLTTILVGSFVLLDLLFVLLYLAVVCYDFWDLLRAKK